MIQCLLDGSRDGCSARMLIKSVPGYRLEVIQMGLHLGVLSKAGRPSWASYHSDVMGEPVMGRPGGLLHPSEGAEM